MVFAFALIAAAAGAGYWYWATYGGGAPAATAEKGEKKAKGKGKGKGGPLTVKATQVVVKPMPVQIEAVGSVEAEQSVQIRAQVSGVLKDVRFKEGDKVKAGQLLFEIDPRTYEAAYKQALAQMARDQAQLENARAQQERLEPLLKREFITRQEYDVAVTSTKSLEATLAADRALVEQARIQLEYARVTAPIAGRTGTLAVKQGNLVSAGASAGGVPLVTINSTDPVLVAFSVPERQFEEIRRNQGGSELRILIIPQREGEVAAEGKLVFIDNTVTTQTGTVLLKTRVANASEILWPGQFVNVRVVLRVEPEALVVPEVAVQPGQESPFVYLVDQGRVKVQPVKVARQIGTDVVIAAGVKAGDSVLTEIPQSLQPGAAVQIGGAEGAGKGKGKGKSKGEVKSQGESPGDSSKASGGGS